MDTSIDAWETRRHHKDKPENSGDSGSEPAAEGNSKPSLSSRLFQLPNLLEGKQ